MSRFVSMAAMAVVVALAAPSSADDRELTMKEVQEARKEIVLENLPLTDEQRAAFDPVYDAYRTEIVKLNERLISLVETFADEFEAATDERTDTIMREALSIRKGRVETREKYLKRFQDAIGAKKTFRLYQIENKLEAIISIQLAAAIPLMPADD